LKYLAIFCIRFYQLFLSRYTPDCIYKPSCSEFAVLAIKKYGFLKGWRKFKERFNRCDSEHLKFYGTDDYP